MIRYFQHRFALSRRGAKDLIGGIIWSTLLNIGLMLPAIYTFLFLESYLKHTTEYGIGYYIAMAIAFMAVIFIIALCQYKSLYTKTYTESANRRISLAEKLRKLPLAFFGEKNLSDLTSTMMEDCTMLETIFSHSVPQFFASLLSLLLISIGLFFYNWQLSLALLWVVPLAGIIHLLSKRWNKEIFSENYHIKRGVTEQIQEGIEEIQEIKAYNGEQKYLHRFGLQLADYEKSLIKGELYTGLWINASFIVFKLGLASVIIVGAWLLGQGSIDLFTYLVFLLIGSSIFNPIMEVFNSLVLLQFLDVRIKRVREMNEMPIQEGKTECIINCFDIEFRNVNFAYKEGRQVLHEVSFTAQQGEVTALVGPSGGGKSTSAKLAARFWDADGGQILLGGIDIATIDPETLLRYYSVVFQDVLLFNASVAENIRIGKPDATDQEIKRVARLAQCDKFIERLPNGYDTLIGENGETLSGGERQRISIARALLKNAPIVLLDEATASIDVENETKIQAGISELIKNKTVIIIAHRMRTVMNAHKIVVLKDGTVIEQGTPSELLSLNGEFAHMAKIQS